MRRKLSLLDERTGELMSTPIYLYSPRGPSIYGNQWMQMSQDPLLTLAKDRELWGVPRAVLDYLCGRLDFENWVSVPQKEIGEYLGIDKAVVSRAISLLVRKKILIKGPAMGRSSSYRLNPAYGWKGNNKRARDFQVALIKGGKPE